MFVNLTKEQKQTIKLLSMGTFLVYFDLFLYAHMAILLNNVFFPPIHSNNQSLLTAFGFCSSFVFRPLGAWLLGSIGDKYGRKVTIVITTVMMGIICLIIAFLPTYAQIGIQATWIILICRMLQEFASIGELIGAQLLLSETIPSPNRSRAVGILAVFAELGGMAAIATVPLAIVYQFNWRIAFMVGACIAVVGAVARTKLRESPEFVDANKKLKHSLKNVKQEPQPGAENHFHKEPVNRKTAFAYFLIKCGGLAFLYFAFVYSANILKANFSYNSYQILVHYLLLGIVQIVGWGLLRIYLSTKIHPLKLLRFVWITISLFIPFLPWLLNHVTAPWQLLIIQSFMVIFHPNDLPSISIFFKSFPVFKRFSSTSLLYATAYMIIYAITSFGITYLIPYVGHGVLLILMVPVLIGYGYGLNHFKNLEKAAGRYPKLITREVRSTSD
ncbi:MAG: hypothetical protein BGO68_05095 [Candidatus Amoebophilus sp. 36-38]|nr:MAG: hypothetical protein BGO68_05095 [Candidatus Amoebophilus sp. 36-38]